MRLPKFCTFQREQLLYLFPVAARPGIATDPLFTSTGLDPMTYLRYIN